MKSIFYQAMIVMLAGSCAEPASESTPNDPAPEDTTKMTIQIPTTACYRYATASDTIFLKVERFPNVVTGILEYRLKEKDKNTGDIDGVLRGDTLVADYTFNSEGTRSTRQVVFLVKDDEVTEGYGEMKVEGGKMIFNNIGSIDFSKGTKLVKVDCEGR